MIIKIHFFNIGFCETNPNKYFHFNVSEQTHFISNDFAFKAYNRWSFITIEIQQTNHSEKQAKFQFFLHSILMSFSGHLCYHFCVIEIFSVIDHFNMKIIFPSKIFYFPKPRFLFRNRSNLNLPDDAFWIVIYHCNILLIK